MDKDIRSRMDTFVKYVFWARSNRGVGDIPLATVPLLHSRLGTHFVIQKSLKAPRITHFRACSKVAF